MFKNIPKRSEESTIDPGFSFVSLYLFILIFFILLVSYSKVSHDAAIINDVFKSFRGENVMTEKIIMLTMEEKQMAEAKHTYRNMIDSFIGPAQIIAQTKSEFDNTRVYKVRFEMNDFFDYLSSNLSREGELVILNLLNIQTAQKNYMLKINITTHIHDLYDTASLDFRRSTALMAKFIDSSKPSSLIEYGITESNEPQTYVIMDIFLQENTLNNQFNNL